MLARTALGVGLAFLALCGGRCKAAGGVTETSASNKPPFSFGCAAGAGSGTSAFCSGTERPFTRIESVDILSDYTNKVGDCLSSERNYLFALLTDWFNYECRLPPNKRAEDSLKLPTSFLLDGMAKYCSFGTPTIAKIVVNYECVKNLNDSVKYPGATFRPDTPTLPSRSEGVDTGSESGAAGGPSSTAKATTKTTKATVTKPISIRDTDAGNNGGDTGVATTPPQNPKTGSSLTETELILAILIPLIFLLILVAVILWYCLCYSGHINKRKESVPSALGASRSSTMFLVPGAYKSTGGDELSGIVYGGSSIANDYAQYAGNTSRRSVDARGGGAGSGADDYSPVYNSVHRVSQASRAGGGGDDDYGGAPPSVIYGNVNGGGNGEPLGLVRSGSVDVADAPTSRRSSADPAESAGFYDRRLSDRRLMMMRHPSESSLSARGSLSTSVVENRKLSRTSYAELPSDRKSSTGSFASATGERKISLSLASADERRASDGLQQQTAAGSRRPTTYGGPGMPEIHESHESVAGDVFYSGESRSVGHLPEAVAASRFDGAPRQQQQQQSGPLGRSSWSGETEADANYSYWPPEWQRWLKNRPSNVNL